MRCLALGLLLALTACGGSQRQDPPEGLRAGQRSRSMSGGTARPQDQARCEADPRLHEVSEYDTSGDDYPDVRKVFLRVGDPPIIRLVLICRESDLNSDGVKDVVRYYSDEGRPLREEADRNFDGGMDEVIYFEDGRIVRIEQDTSRDGKVDTKIYYEEGQPVRTERDMAGRSTDTRWQPDRWEYFENGRMIRMGNDLDGDGRVDRWDRDEEYRRSQEQLRAAEAAQGAEEQSDDTYGGDAEAGEGEGGNTGGAAEGSSGAVGGGAG